jgi:DNA-binding transcriptional LysR family regulator
MDSLDLTLLAGFVAVAEERSFTRAAKRLGVSPSAVSHSIRSLEEEIGVRLLSRTTRSVAPTAAGEQLLLRLRPAMADIRESVDGIARLRDRPAGQVRLLMPRLAALTVLMPKLAGFVRDYPDIVVDVTVHEPIDDIVSRGFDAGIHFGEYIERDMIAVRVSSDHRAAIVSSPEYFRSHPKPKSPRDLLNHRCINFRHGPASVYRWEFEKGKRSLSVGVRGPLVVDDVDILVRAALDGIGLAFISESQVASHIAEGRLVRVLEDWCQPFPGFFLYYPSRRHQPAALSALIGFLRI